MPPDPATGRRRQRSITVHGSRRDAEAELRRLSEHVLPPPGSHVGTNLTLARLLDVWWESKRSTVAASTAREYQRIIDTRLKPELGAQASEPVVTVPSRRLLRRITPRRSASRVDPSDPCGVARRRARSSASVGVAADQSRRGDATAASTKARDRPAVARTDPTPPRARGAGVETVRSVRAPRRRCSAPAAVSCAGCGGRTSTSTPRTLTIRTGIADVAGRLVETDTKSHKPRTISLDVDTARRLRRHRRWAERAAACHDTALDPRAFVLSEAVDGASPYRPDKATGTFRRVAKRAGIPKTRLHDLRHFAATQLIGAGCDLRTVAGRLGHGQPWTTLNTYAAFLPERDQVAADHLAAVLENGRTARRPEQRHSTSAKPSRRSEAPSFGGGGRRAGRPSTSVNRRR